MQAPFVSPSSILTQTLHCVLILTVVLQCSSAIKDLVACDGHNVEPVSNQLRYTGPNQRITREGKSHFRCFQGQHYEDLYLFQHVFSNVTGGFFVELGALDGYSYSSSYFYEKFLNWNGLLIEASPHNEELFRARSKKLKASRRRRVPFIPAAVCSENRAVTYVSKSGTGAGILEFMPQDVQERNKKECEKGPKKGAGCVLQEISCINLQGELKRRNVAHIDMFILDVEGAEFEVIKTLNFTETPVRYFVVELDGKSPEKDAQVRCLLRKATFTPLGRLELNEVWMAQNFKVHPDRYGAVNTHMRRNYEKCFAGSIDGALHTATISGSKGEHAVPVTTEEVNLIKGLDSDFTDFPVTERLRDEQQRDVVDSQRTAAFYAEVSVVGALFLFFAVIVFRCTNRSRRK